MTQKCTAKIFKFRTPEKIAVIILKFEQCDFSYTNDSIWCRPNNKHCRPWSDCSFRQICLSKIPHFLKNWNILWMQTLHLSHRMTKPTKWCVPSEDSDQSWHLGIRPDWSESLLSAWRKLGSLATHWAHSEDSDQTSPGWSESWLGAQVILWV